MIAIECEFDKLWILDTFQALKVCIIKYLLDTRSELQIIYSDTHIIKPFSM